MAEIDLGVIDLGIGRPHHAVLPVAEISAASLRVAAGGSRDGLQYGPDPGMYDLRSLLAHFLSAQYGLEVRSQELVMTYGASHALDLVLGRYTQPGDTVLVEDPTYFFALDVLRGRGVRPIPVAMDQQGIVPDDLRQQLRTHSPRLLYTVPTFHNPTGIVHTSARRQEVVALTKEHDCWIVADEVYHLLCDGTRPKPLRAYSADNVLSISSFSKILAPGLRLGWVEAAPRHIDQLLQCGVFRSGGAASPYVSSIVEEVITLGDLDRVLIGLRTFYADRMRGVVAALRHELPAEVTFEDPGGGFFLWLRAPATVDFEHLRDRARDMGVDYRAGSLFSCHGSFANCLRICCTYYSEQETREGIVRLGQFLRRTFS